MSKRLLESGDIRLLESGDSRLIEESATTVSATLAGDGGGTGSITATVSRLATLSGVGGGTGSIAATPTVLATLSGIGGGVGTATAVITHPAVLVGIGGGTGAASATSAPVVNATLAGVGGGTGAITATPSVLATLSGIGGGTGVATAVVTRLATLAGVGGGVGAITVTPSVLATFVGIGGGVGVVTATPVVVATAIGVGGGTGTATAVVTRLATLLGIGGGTGSAMAGSFAGVSGVLAGIGGGVGALTAVITHRGVLVGVGGGTGTATAVRTDVAQFAQGDGEGNGEMLATPVIVATENGVGGGTGHATAKPIVLATASGVGGGVGHLQGAVAGIASGIGGGAGAASAGIIVVVTASGIGGGVGASSAGLTKIVTAIGVGLGQGHITAKLLVIASAAGDSGGTGHAVGVVIVVGVLDGVGGGGAGEIDGDIFGPGFWFGAGVGGGHGFIVGTIVIAAVATSDGGGTGGFTVEIPIRLAIAVGLGGGVGQAVVDTVIAALFAGTGQGIGVFQASLLRPSPPRLDRAIDRLFVTPMTIILPGMATDRYSNDVPNWNEPTVTGVLGHVQDVTSFEALGNRDTVGVVKRVFLPADASINALARLVIDGVTYEVDGAPIMARTPTGPHHWEVNLRIFDANAEPGTIPPTKLDRPIDQLFVVPMTVINPSRATDRYNNEVLDWIDTTVVEAFGHEQDVSSSESLGNRDTVHVSKRVFMPASTMVTALSRIVIDAVMYEVDGTPIIAHTPQGPHHLEVGLRVFDADGLIPEEPLTRTSLSIDHFFVVPMTIVTPARTTDRYTNDVPDWNDIVTINAFGHEQDLSSFESLGNRDTVTISKRVYLPVDIAVTALSRVIIAGVTYEVDGTPIMARGPQGPHHLEVNLRIFDAGGV